MSASTSPKKQFALNPNAKTFKLPKGAEQSNFNWESLEQNSGDNSNAETPFEEPPQLPAVDPRAGAVEAPTVPTRTVARGVLLKRSVWLKQWNKRHVIVSPSLITWYTLAGEQKGMMSLTPSTSASLDASTTATLRIIEGGRELAFREAEAEHALLGAMPLSVWKQVIQHAAAPAPAIAAGDTGYVLPTRALEGAAAEATLERWALHAENSIKSSPSNEMR